MPLNERTSIIEELTPSFSIKKPDQQTSPVVLNSPHSGRIYPKTFVASSRLNPKTLRRSEDCFIDELFGPTAELGVPLLAANFPRAYLDVNREPFELDPNLFMELLPDYANSGSVRVAGGLGTIARVVADGEEIYRDPPTLKAAFERIKRLYYPYHTALSDLLAETTGRFGSALLIDCHSMPSASANGGSGVRPDFVIGDRFGASCCNRISGFLQAEIRQLGYEVHMNRPYAGGYITEHYGQPTKGVHAVQIEINRALYLDEDELQQTSGFEKLQNDLRTIAQHLFSILPGLLSEQAAAE